MAVGQAKKSEKKYHSSVEDFIPYAAHYDEDTIITKNGELMEVIKITGFNFETIAGDSTKDLRQIIRNTILNHVKTDEVAVWLHTFRTKVNIDTDASKLKGFNKFLHEKWVEKNEWNNQYVNELYITFLGEGEKLDIVDPKVIWENIHPTTQMKKRKEALTRSAEKLDKITRAVMQDLASFGATKLTVYKEDGVYYSEILSFVSKLMNLVEQKIPLEPVDLSMLFPSNKVVFQYNVVQVEEFNLKHYGAIFSVKEYQEVSTREIDKFLQLPVQFMVSESFNFVSKDEALEAYKDQMKIYELSGSQFMSDITGVSDIIKGGGEANFYGEHQITITVLEDSVKEMQKAVSLVVDALRELGVVFVREDLYLEYCYWSQMPGNFDFLKRQSYISTNKIGGYASLYNFPAGKRTNNKWGEAVTLFRTAKNTPYFFNFHDGESGHSCLIGPKGAGKTVLLNFLVSEAQKYEGNSFYFEKDKASEIFIKASAGKYNKISELIDQGRLYLNPLLLPDTPNNRRFLVEWLEYLIEFIDENGNPVANYMPISKEDLDLIEKAVEVNYSSPKEERMLSFLVPKIWGNNPESSATAKRLSYWYMSGKFSKYFDSGIDNLDTKAKIVGFDLSQIINNKSIAVPMSFYLLHKVEDLMSIDKPTIIVLDEAWDIIDNPAFAPRIENWLERITEKNGIVIFATDAPEKAEKSYVTKRIMPLIATKIILPNPNASQNYQTIFGLNESEFKAVTKLDLASHQFVLKRGEDSVVCKLSLQGMNDLLSVLTSNQESLLLMKSLIAQNGDNPDKWLAEFFRNQKG
ncbi:MAG: hypothetical protein SFT90_05865 [Rickettsiales bacterium]|nr:hypothetical protein [Rickettsiales bacterium]